MFLFSSFSGHCHFEQLPYAQIASDNAVSESTVQLCMERTLHLFRACLEDRKNVALVWRDLGMLLIQGRDVNMGFYTDFLERLNGTDEALQALLEVGFPFSQRHPWFCSGGAGGLLSPGLP